MAHPLAVALQTQERSGAWLARRTGKSPSYVLKVIDGTRRPSDDFKRLASDALGEPAEKLFPAVQAVA